MLYESHFCATVVFMSISPNFLPEGFHIEHTDSPSGPMDILVQNEGRTIRVDLSSEIDTSEPTLRLPTQS